MTLDTKSIRERAERATPGPWFHKTHSYGPRHNKIVSHSLCHVDTDGIAMNADNIAFIAAARTDVPALCDEVDSLRAALAKAERERDEARKQLLNDADVKRIADEFDDARRETFEATREACIHEARAAKAVWSDSCAHERMAAQEACDYIASAIQAYVKPADVLGTPAPATNTGDEPK
jgi:hypothetical protein